MKSLNLKGTTVLQKNLNADTKIVVNQGGTRSGKTIALLQLIIIKALQETDCVFTIVRKSFPSLRISVLRDFINLLQEYNLYNEDLYNKSDQVFRINGNIIEFVSLDSPMKKRGSKRDYLFINECNELNYEDYFQLIIRTTKRIYMDFNPSDEFSWIYDKVLSRADCTFIKSTYLDNPFLNIESIQEIERLRDTDLNYWNIYGLGERGKSQALIFPNFKIIQKIPDNAKHLAYGLDFGYAVDPTALIEIFKHENNLYFKQLLYERRLTNYDIGNKFVSLGIDRRGSIFADSSEPKSIEELYRMNWNVKPTKKGRDSINIGIDVLRRYKLHITESSKELIKEFRTYKYEVDKSGVVLQKPVDKDNHGIDAVRYGCIMTLSRPNFGKYYIS